MKQHKPDILVFQRMIPAYRRGVFKQLCERLNALICYSPQKKNSGFGDQNNFDFPTEKLLSLKYTKSATAIIQCPLRVLLKYKPKVVISEGAISYLTLWKLFFFRPFFNYKLIVWTHGIKNSELNQPFKGLSGKLRLFLYRRADALLIYTGNRKNELARCIKKTSNIFIAWNSLDTDQYLSLYAQLQTQGKAAIKEKLQWKSTFNLIFLGRLIPNKRVEELITSIKKHPFTFDVQVHIVGEGPEKNKLQQIAEGHDNIIFYGEIFDEELLGTLLYASDLMVLPGRIGLPLIHAFCFACPIVTCGGNYDSPEVEYLVSGHNGLLVEESENLAPEIEKLLAGKDLEKLSENALQTIHEKANSKRMIDGFEEAVNYVLRTSA